MSAFKRIYYKLSIKNISPLSIGSGENEDTDHDILTDRYGRPFIPATAIAGVMRSYIDDDALFGYIKERTTQGEASKVRFYDAIPDEKQAFESTKFIITNRDQVALEKKIGKDGAKFDMQALEPGYKFISYIELLTDENNAENKIEDAIAAFNTGELAFGTKTNRGYGRIKISAQKKVISSVDEYIEFNMYESEYDNKVIFNKVSDEYKISLELVGGISIREYYTDEHNDVTEMVPDYGQMTLSDDTPVIPGTSWAGMFRSRFTEFTDKNKADDLFGFVDEKTNTSKPSKIKFSESTLTNGTWKVTTRNSIDRFSGATKDSALYTERTYYYGKTELSIRFKTNQSEYKSIIGYCLADLNDGFLALGGLTSVGRGLFRVTAIKHGNKELTDITSQNIIDFMKGETGND